MVDDPHMRQAFESRIQDLGLATLDEHDRGRLWQGYLKQHELAASYDHAVAPAQEPAITVFVPVSHNRGSV